MKTFSSVARELLGLFVEDGAFALQLGAVLAVVVLLNAFSVGSADVRALCLVLFPAMILLLNVARTRRR